MPNATQLATGRSYFTHRLPTGEIIRRDVTGKMAAGDAAFAALLRSGARAWRNIDRGFTAEERQPYGPAPRPVGEFDPFNPRPNARR